VKPEIEKLIEEARQEFQREQEEIKQAVVVCARVLVPNELHPYIVVTACDTPQKEFVITGAEGLGDIVCRFDDVEDLFTNVRWYAKQYEFEVGRGNFYSQATYGDNPGIKETLVECDSFKHAVIIAAGPDFVGSWERALTEKQAREKIGKEKQQINDKFLADFYARRSEKPATLWEKFLNLFGGDE
jgi:hypothetical protein